MIATFKVSNPCVSQGRNGIIKTTGVEVMTSSYGVMLSPITSKGNPGNAWIEMDCETLTEIAKWWLKQPESKEEAE